MRFSNVIGLLLLITSMIVVSCEEELCDNTCPFANDGVCDDGGSDAMHDVCQLGTDCNDCGSRTP